MQKYLLSSSLQIISLTWHFMSAVNQINDDNIKTDYMYWKRIFTGDLDNISDYKNDNVGLSQNRKISKAAYYIYIYSWTS